MPKSTGPKSTGPISSIFGKSEELGKQKELVKWAIHIPSVSEVVPNAGHILEGVSGWPDVKYLGKNNIKTILDLVKGNLSALIKEQRVAGGHYNILNKITADDFKISEEDSLDFSKCGSCGYAEVWGCKEESRFLSILGCKLYRMSWSHRSPDTDCVFLSMEAELITKFAMEFKEEMELLEEKIIKSETGIQILENFLAMATVDKPCLPKLRNYWDYEESDKSFFFLDSNGKFVHGVIAFMDEYIVYGVRLSGVNQHERTGQNRCVGHYQKGCILFPKEIQYLFSALEHDRRFLKIFMENGNWSLGNFEEALHSLDPAILEEN